MGGCVIAVQVGQQQHTLPACPFDKTAVRMLLAGQIVLAFGSRG